MPGSPGYERDVIHPRVESWLRENGYTDVYHEPSLGNGRPDLIAHKGGQTLIVECKQRSDIQTAGKHLWQLRRYREQYQAIRHWRRKLRLGGELVKVALVAEYISPSAAEAYAYGGVNAFEITKDSQPSFDIESLLRFRPKLTSDMLDIPRASQAKSYFKTRLHALWKAKQQRDGLHRLNPLVVADATGIFTPMLRAWRYDNLSRIDARTLYRLTDYFECSPNYLLRMYKNEQDVA